VVILFGTNFAAGLAQKGPHGFEERPNSGPKLALDAVPWLTGILDFVQQGWPATENSGNGSKQGRHGLMINTRNV